MPLLFSSPETNGCPVALLDGSWPKKNSWWLHHGVKKLARSIKDLSGEHWILITPNGRVRETHFPRDIDANGILKILWTDRSARRCRE